MGVEFVKTHSNWLNPEICRWIDDALNPASNRADVEQRAKDVLDHLQVVASPTRLRYQFEVLITKREEAFNVIFNRVFERNPDQIIAAAETLHPSRTSFYPLWKRVCWIQIPKTVAGVSDNKVTKYLILIITLTLCFTIFTIMVYRISGYSFRLFTNTIPLRMRKLLAAHMLVQTVLIRYLPEIPYITRIARRVAVINPLSFIMPLDGSHSLGEFVTFLFVNTVDFSTQTLAFIRERAAKADNERLTICKAKAYEVWKSALLANAPAA